MALWAHVPGVYWDYIVGERRPARQLLDADYQKTSRMVCPPTWAAHCAPFFVTVKAALSTHPRRWNGTEQNEPKGPQRSSTPGLSSLFPMPSKEHPVETPSTVEWMRNCCMVPDAHDKIPDPDFNSRCQFHKLRSFVSSTKQRGSALHSKLNSFVRFLG